MPLFRGCVERLSLHAPPQFAAWPAKYYSILNQTQSPAGRQQIWILLRALQFRCSSLESGALLMSACMRSAKHSRWRSTAAEPREVQATNAPSRPANGHASNAGKGTWINPQAARSIDQMDILRFGFTPLYTGFADVWHAVEQLHAVMSSGEWTQDRYQRKQAVT